MKTQNLNKYGLEFAGRRLTKRRLGCWLWVMVAAIVLALGVSAARAETGRFAPLSLEGRGGEVVLHAGFGVPNWVAFGVVTTLVLAVIGRLAWGWCVERDERSTYSDERWDPYAGDWDAPTPTMAPTPARSGGGAGELVGPRGVDWTNGARTNAWDGDLLNADEGVRAPQETMPEGLTWLEVVDIVHACASRVGLIRSIVQGAQRPSTDDEQEEALATAERMLGDLRVTLWELRARFQGKDAPPRLEGRGDEGAGLTGVTSLTGGKEGAV